MLRYKKHHLSFTFGAEGCISQQKHHRVDVVGYPRPLNLEVALKNHLEVSKLFSVFIKKCFHEFSPHFFRRAIPNDDWLELYLKGLHPFLVLVIEGTS